MRLVPPAAITFATANIVFATATIVAASACAALSPSDVVTLQPTPAPTLAVARTEAADRVRGWRRFHVEPRFATDGEADGEHGCGDALRGGWLQLDAEGPSWIFANERACESFFHSRHWGTGVHVGVDAFRVFVSDVAVTSGPMTIYEARTACGVLDPSSACRNDFHEGAWMVLSVVGPVVSVAAFEGSAGAGGPPYGSEIWTTVDLRTGEAATLDALVTEASLLEAMVGSAKVAERLDDAELAQLKASTTVRDALAAWGVDRASAFGSYTFVSDDATGADVTLRLGVLWSYGGMSPNTLEHVDLRVRVKLEAAAWLAAAREGSGFLAPREAPRR